MERFRWTILAAIVAVMLLGAFSRPANLAAANAVSGDDNVATINNVGGADQLISLNTDSNLADPNQMVLLRSDGHDGQTQQAITMDENSTAQQMATNTSAGNGAGKQCASTKGFNGHNWAATVFWRNDEWQQQIAFGNYSGLRHPQANTGATFNDTGPQIALGVATTFNPPGRQYMAANYEQWTDGHLVAWRDDANMDGAAMAATGHHRLRALRQYLLGYEITMQQPASRQALLL